MCQGGKQNAHAPVEGLWVSAHRITVQPALVQPALAWLALAWSM